MDNAKDILDYLQKVIELTENLENKSTISIIVSVCVLILLPLLVFVLYKITNSMIEQNSKRYETSLANISNIVFQNNEISKDIKTTTIEQGNKIRISVYQEAYKLFFEIQHSLEILKESESREEEYKNLDAKIHDLRVNIFINAIYLNELTEPLLNVQIALWDILTIQYLKCSGKDYDTRKDLQCWLDFENNIRESEKLIRESMKTYLSLKDTDFSKNIEKEIKETRDKYVKNKIPELK